MSESKLISVVTVVKDDLDGFTSSMTSLKEQTTINFELVVVDSSANTTQIPEQIKAIALNNEIPINYQWCEPRGIYPAMNTGLTAATGKYTYFLNAGDTFYAPDVLEKVTRELEHKQPTWQPTWLFGPVVVTNQDTNTSTTTPMWNYQAEQKNFFARGLFPSHQGTFALTQTLIDLGGFDPKYSISADYALFLKLATVSDPAEVNFPIADFATGGVSTHQWRESFHQFHQARKEIMRPQGTNALREEFWTRWHYGKVWTYRELILRARR
jgi:glycosyltransferase involved in cell wall biosynthesis